MSSDKEQFEALRAEIARDLRPVRPLRLERHFYPALAAITAVFLALLWWRYDWRFDAELLGGLGHWGFSVIEIAIAVALLGLGLREAIPGRSVSTTVLIVSGAVAASLQLAFCWVTFGLSPVSVPEGMQAEYWLFCFCLELILGIPLALLCLAFIRRGLVTFYLRVGLLSGLGAGLIGDALWRLVCPYSDPLHTLTSHSGGIAAVAAGGLLLTALWDRERIEAWISRRRG